MEFSLVLLIALGVLLLLSLFTVEQQSAALVQRFGKFVRVAHPGLNLRIPLIEQIGGKVNLRVQQLDVRVETKTKDNVFVHCIVSVQYFVRPEKVFQAFYLFDNPDRQITSFVFDVVRARVPKMPIDDVFEKKDEIADAIKDELTSMMDDFGYGIIKTLVTDIEPDSKVKEAMNEINAAQRLRVAASEKAEAERILAVKRAEAEAEAKALQGRGIADQRRAIVDGLRESVEDFKNGVPGTSAQEVLSLVLMTQYFDTLKDIGAASRTNTILVPHSPGYMQDLASEMRNSILLGNTASAHAAEHASGHAAQKRHPSHG